MRQRKRSFNRWGIRRVARFAGLGLVLPIACSLQSNAVVTANLSNQGGMFDVRPRFFCEGDAVEVRWALDATDTLTFEAPCSVQLFDTCLVGGGVLGSSEVTIELDVQVFLSSHPQSGGSDDDPETLFVGDSSVPPDENVGVRTVHPVEDTTFELLAEIEGLGRLPVERRHVNLIRPDEFRFHNQRFEWGCDNGESGGPGWSSKSSERGELGSANVTMVSVLSLSEETILVTLKRDRDDEGLPPLIVEDVLEPGASSEMFTGEMYGVWTVVPLEYTDENGSLICETPPSEPILDLPPAASADDRLADIEITVQLGCVDAMTLTDEDTE